MEPLTIALSVLLGLITPLGVVSDRVAEQQIRKQLYKAESLQVRIDNAPSYQLLHGKVDKVRMAGRGLYLTPDLRIDTLEMETDPIALAGLQAKLEQPLQGAIRLTLTEADINRAFLAPQFVEVLENLGTDRDRRRGRYKVLNPQIKLLGGDRLRITAQLTERGFPDKLNITIETSVRVTAGRSVSLVDTVVKANDKLAPQVLVDALSRGATQQFDLNQLEAQGMTVRILKLEQVSDGLPNNPQNGLQLVGFLQLRPQSEKIPEKILEKNP
jgi:LmeA-like phospholipid-binding